MVITKTYIFIHIPKTAGTSISRSLNPNYMRDSLAQRWKGHVTLHNLRRRNPNIDKSRFTFAFVRNPWDRLLSNFHHIKKYARRNNVLYKSNIEFNDWVIMHLPGMAIDKNQRYPSWRNPHLLQYTWIKPGVDFVGRFENLEEDFAYVCDRLQIDRQLKYEKLNSSEHKHYTEVYNDEARKVVGEIFKADIEMFDYSF